MTAIDNRWTHVCELAELAPDRGVAALVGDRHVAIFRLTGTDEVRALDNVDPFSGASVLSRGLIGTEMLDGQWVPYVASPLRKQRFSLHDGICLDKPAVQLDTFRVQVRSGVVEVAATS